MNEDELLRLLDENRVTSGNLIKELFIAKQGNYREDLKHKIRQLYKETRRRLVVLEFWDNLLNPLMSDKTLGERREG